MFKRIGDLNVNYDVRGDGYPLVLLHGGGSRAQTFEHMVPLLAKTFRVYVFDQRGFGDTERPPDPKLSYPIWRQDLLRFLDAFGLERVALGGWSLGGVVSLDFVVNHPERITQLVLIGTSNPRLPSSDRSGFQRRRELIERGATAEQIVTETFEFTKRAFSPFSLEHNSAAVEALRQEHLRNNPRYYLEMLQANEQRPAIGDRLAHIGCPTLIIVGEHDARTPLALSEDLNKAIPASFLKIVPNCGHFYSYEQPELVSAVMTTFLEAFAARPTDRVAARMA
jgi:pimeloyl-ACP methyl ester carboxylesterase